MIRPNEDQMLTCLRTAVRDKAVIRGECSGFKRSMPLAFNGLGKTVKFRLL